ncbi:MAG: cell wall-binding repeat-containing protein, partial [Bradymonadaceae bacterium]
MPFSFRQLFLLALGMSFVILAGCGDGNVRLTTGPNSGNQGCEDGECPSGQSCYRGACYKDCAGSGDCPGNARCHEGRCAPMDCSGVKCHAEETCHQGVCYPNCEGESDCDGEARCFEGGCVPTSCDEVICPGVQICHRGVCYPEHPGCEGDDDCPADNACRRGECEPHCDSNLDCVEPLLCVDPCGGAASCMDAKTCRDPNPCAGVNCPAGQICRDGDCTVPCQGIDCGQGEFCFLDRCYESPDAALCQGVNCDAGYRCVNGNCYKDEGDCVPFAECPDGSICRPVAADEAFCMSQDCGLMTCVAGTVCQNGQCNPVCGPDNPCEAPAAICMEMCPGEADGCDSGCYDQCSTSACPPGQTCDWDRCYDECWAASECAANERCFHGRCVPLDCTGVVCGPTEACSRGGCVLPCQNNAECPGEALCRQGLCDDPCDETRCPAGQTCSQGVCYDECGTECPDDHVCIRRDVGENYCSPLSCEGVECAEGNACYRGRCKAECSDDDECPSPETCDLSQNPSVCVGECDEVVCPGDTHCFEGRCHQECTYQEDCPDAHYCHYNGLCVPSNCPECSNGMVCNENTFTCTLCTQVERIWPTWLDCWMSTCRVATSVALSRHRYPSGVSTAVIALGAESETGAGVDAMSGGPLAYKLNAPILLSAHSHLSWSTRQELTRLRNAPTRLQRVVILGGPFAISNDVENAIRALGIPRVERVFGHTRMDTSIEVARAVNASPTIVFLADAWVLDGHLVSGVAAALGAPVLLTDTDELTDVIADYLNAHSSTIIETVVIGSQSAIPDSVMAQIPTPTRRITGANQYDVSAAIAAYAVNERGLNPSHVNIAEGKTLHDSLSAGATGRILLVSQTSCLKNWPCADPTAPTAAYTFLETQGVNRVTLVGTASAL